MSPLVVFLLHAAALVLAYLVLVFVHEKAWYWHVLSIGLAIGIGLSLLRPWPTHETELLASLLFAFLLLWGFAGPVFAAIHRQDHGSSA
jgi:hypothetical protein